jgi:hypothetical protein
MNTIKTAVVTATLLAVGYGAHVVMNKPIPTEGIWEELSQGVPNAEGPSIEIPELMPAQDASEPAIGSQARSDSPFAQAGVYGATDQSNAAPPQFSSQSNPLQTVPPPETLSNPQVPQSEFDRSDAGVAHIPNTGAGNAIRSSFEQQVAAQSNPNFDAIWRSAQDLVAKGNLADALFTLSMLYKDDVSDSQRDMLIPLLDQLAGTVIYSRQSYLENPWVGNAPTSLEELSQQLNVPAEFLGRINGIASGTMIPAGKPIKIVRGPFRGALDLSRRELTIFLGESYAGRFNVSIGRDFVEQPMVYAVTEKSGAYNYVDSRTNQQIPAGDPTNPLGNHWIGIANRQTQAVAGIHSVGSAVDASDSRGFISVTPKDADDLQAILSINSTITVVP